MPKGIYTHKKGYKRKDFSEEWKKKISVSKKQNPTRYWLNKKRNPISWIGKKATEISKQKIRIAKLGKSPWNKGTKGLKLGVKGDKHYRWRGGLPKCIDCHKQLKNRNAKRCVLCYRKTNPHKGEKNVNWNNGISRLNKTERQLLMQTSEYKLWRKAVFERDNYTCVWCGLKAVKLNADHIKPWRDYPELRFAIDNGRTLCEKCHRTTDTYGCNIRKLSLIK